MAQMSTDQLLAAALTLSGQTAAPRDSVIAHPGTRISHVLLGLEVGVAELFMARQLGYHAVLAYHAPDGSGLTWSAAEHARGLQELGVPIADYRGALGAYAAHLQRLAAQHIPDRAASVARLLDLPFLSIQTPFALIAQRAIQATLDDALHAHPDATLQDLQDALRTLTPFAAAPVSFPEPYAGWDAPAGRVMVAPLTVAPPSAAIARAYFAQGVRTLCVASFGEADWHELAHDQMDGNIFILGEAACASVGILPYVAGLRSQGIEVTTFAGVLGDAS
jgi:hypothetical protein